MLLKRDVKAGLKTNVLNNNTTKPFIDIKCTYNTRMAAHSQSFKWVGEGYFTVICKKKSEKGIRNF